MRIGGGQAGQRRLEVRRRVRQAGELRAIGVTLAHGHADLGQAQRGVAGQRPAPAGAIRVGLLDGVLGGEEVLGDARQVSARRRAVGRHLIDAAVHAQRGAAAQRPLGVEPGQAVDAAVVGGGDAGQRDGGQRRGLFPPQHRGRHQGGGAGVERFIGGQHIHPVAHRLPFALVHGEQRQHRQFGFAAVVEHMVRQAGQRAAGFKPWL